MVVGGFPGGASGKEPACQCRRCKRFRFDLWVGKIPGEGNGNLLQYSSLENLMDRGAWQATVHGITKSWAWLSSHTHTHTHTHSVYMLMLLSQFVPPLPPLCPKVSLRPSLPLSNRKQYPGNVLPGAEGSWRSPEYDGNSLEGAGLGAAAVGMKVGICPSHPLSEQEHDGRRGEGFPTSFYPLDSFAQN